MTFGATASERITVEYRRQLIDVGNPLGDFGAAYFVTINEVEVRNAVASAVRRINVFGGGGRDIITGPASFAEVYTQTRSGTELTGYGAPADAVAPMDADGGSGSDRLYGGTGDDTLIGGRGNDVLIDQYGSNTLNGGAGIDSFNTLGGKARVLRTRVGVSVVRYAAVSRGTPDGIFDDGTVGGILLYNGDDTIDAGGNVRASDFADNAFLGRLV